MRISVRVTELTWFVTCAYKQQYDKSEFNVLNTYHWDLLNVWLTSQWDFEPFWEWYAEHFVWDIKQKEASLRNTYQINLFKQSIWMFLQNVYHEAKVHYPYGEDYLVTGTPDVAAVPQAMNEKEYLWAEDFFEKTGVDIWPIEDLWRYVFVFDGKHSKLGQYYYTNDKEKDMEKRNFNMQTYLYPLFLMDMWRLSWDHRDLATFTYLVHDKVTGKYRYESVLRTYDECKNKLDEVMSAFIESKTLEEYPANTNKNCYFCPLYRKCPATKWTLLVQEDDWFF